MARYFWWFLLVGALAAAPYASANGILTVACSDVTILENGVQQNAYCDVDNETGANATFTSFFPDATVYVSGDPDDAIAGILWGIGDGTCTLTIADGTKCTVRLGLVTNDGSGDTPTDFGVYSLSLHLEYSIPVGEDPRASTGLNITVVDPGFVPEPATLALLSLGLVGLGFSRRKQ